MSAERGEPNGELILCDPASLDRALAAKPARSPISTEMGKNRQLPATTRKREENQSVCFECR
jgi:hypothetical protein